jgi:glutamate racemase
MKPEDLPIGLFDSGVGGLTVMREVARLLPNENLVYLGDTARVPYGTRSGEAIRKYTWEATTFLLKEQIKLLIVACHTACSHSLEMLQEKCPVPVIGVVRSGLETLILHARGRRVAILGTPSTIGSGLYQKIIHQHDPQIQVFPVACPLFVPLIEERLFDHPATQLIADHYLHALRDQHIDAALLACTHYPLIRPIIQQAIGPKVILIEPAAAVAQETLQHLSLSNTLRQNKQPHLRFYVTDDPEKFRLIARHFFGSEVKKVHTANLFGED